MNNITLKPCPFCGYEKPFLTFCEYDKCKWTISCPQCHIECTVPVLREFVGSVRIGRRRSNENSLIEAWNKRTNDADNS